MAMEIRRWRGDRLQESANKHNHHRQDQASGRCLVTGIEESTSSALVPAVQQPNDFSQVLISFFAAVCHLVRSRSLRD